MSIFFYQEMVKKCVALVINGTQRVDIVTVCMKFKQMRRF